MTDKQINHKKRRERQNKNRSVGRCVKTMDYIPEPIEKHLNASVCTIPSEVETVYAEYYASQKVRRMQCATL